MWEAYPVCEGDILIKGREVDISPLVSQLHDLYRLLL